MKAAFVYDRMFENHRCQHEHPERPERLAAVLDGLKTAGAWDGALQIPARPATREELQQVHKDRYVDAVLDVMGRVDFGHLDSDTYFSPGSMDASLSAAGGGVDLARAVHERQADWGMAVVRPPGHHATWNRACGFCIFNNIAVAAADLLRSGRAERIAIVDWDVHHGNGTQDQFWDNPKVLYASIHQWPFYPGSGLSDETGGPAAPGKTVNFPFPSFGEDSDYLYAVDTVVLPLLRAFRPDHVMISAGFDAHRDDPLASMRLTADCFGQMAYRLKEAADEICQGRLTLFLEGGYSLSALEESAEATARGIAKSILRKPTVGGLPDTPQKRVVRNTLEALIAHWPAKTFESD